MGFDFHITSIDDFIKFISFIQGRALTEEEIKHQVERLEKLRINLQTSIDKEKNHVG